MDPITNFAFSTVVTAPSPAISGTSLGIGVGDGALFPQPSTAGSYNVIVIPAGAQSSIANAEIIRVTARSTDTFSTIVRAQEGTSARAIQVGDQVILAATAKWFTDLAAGIVDRQVFTASGTWTKPAGVKRVSVICVGAGGGGSSGARRASGTASVGGGPGAGGIALVSEFAASDLGATVAVVVGAGGTGGAGQTADSSPGLVGGTGNNSSFGSHLLAAGGFGGTAAGAGGAARIGDGGAGPTASAAGGAGSPPGSPAGGWLSCPGSSGGGVSTAPAQSAGGAGTSSIPGVSSGAQVGGIAGGGNATPVAVPTTMADAFYAALVSYGGAGGGSATAAAGGSGGTGQGYGAGGGGGGASLNTFTSGKGGDGAPGIVIVTSYS